MPIAPKPDMPGKTCKACGAPLVRKRYRNSLESYDRYLAREHCSQSCANTKAELASKDGHHWRARQHRKPACEECGVTRRLHVHHKDRDRTNNDPGNLATLCGSCHLKLHWREDREKRLAANPFVQRRQPSVCVICEGEFFPRHKRTQTCSPACKAGLLSRRTTEHYARRGTTA
jgi:hypothetical protein